ncbi:MAG: hydrogenase formation protein HypD [Lentisphaeria bacterium]|nr:hydrogenase formation protein HypD [Lentisphaeria bacterium]
MKSPLKIIEEYSGRPLRIMEVCGTHTHEIFRHGIRKILPPAITLVSGPGCPVCVTPPGYIDSAVDLALKHHAVICTFGDLIRVPGSETSLAGARTQGAEIRPVYTPLDAVEIARENPEKEVVFLAVGFETTAPSACIAVKHAKRDKVKNFSLLTSNKTMPQAYRTLAGCVDAFLYPGHVHTIIGSGICRELVTSGVSGVIAGFQADELLTALAVIAVRANEGQGAFFENCYPRVARDEGNPAALKLLDEVMAPCDAEWRGLGVIPGSGLKLGGEYADFDARLKFGEPECSGRPHPGCRCGEILKGVLKPEGCPLFGKVCTPLHPVGACMVSHEGACSAYYQYER